MRRIVTTTHKNYSIAYGDMFGPTSLMLEYLQEIYMFYHDTNTPLYAYLNGMTYIFTTAEEDAEGAIKIAGTFSRSTPPDITGEILYNIFRFDPEEDEISLEAALKRKMNPKLQNQLQKAIDMYYSDMYRIVVPFEIIHI